MEHFQVVEEAKHQKYSVLPYVYVDYIVIIKREKTFFYQFSYGCILRSKCHMMH